MVSERIRTLFFDMATLPRDFMQAISRPIIHVGIVIEQFRVVGNVNGFLRDDRSNKSTWRGSWERIGRLMPRAINLCDTISNFNLEFSIDLRVSLIRGHLFRIGKKI
jgi:hypothetical protein